MHTIASLSLINVAEASLRRYLERQLHTLQHYEFAPEEMSSCETLKNTVYTLREKLPNVIQSALALLPNGNGEFACRSLSQDLLLVGSSESCNCSTRSILLVHVIDMAIRFCKVCKKWKVLASDNVLWSNLFQDRWGGDRAAFYAPVDSKLWKHAYEVQDRCDRIGLGLKIIREGGDTILFTKEKSNGIWVRGEKVKGQPVLKIQKQSLQEINS
ncbi:hypothetical protein GH714_031716 [Hevea brasiliensis]|uniref:F-box domain-containing protein n=1 Tax=Hevea brasiliensis TaxID=3981 RepID=A0A6A6LD64_HEVBR|nr:hypothetical protein GH714_031716 [Hevea brasiliensis]